MISALYSGMVKNDSKLYFQYLLEQLQKSVNGWGTHWVSTSPPTPTLHTFKTERIQLFEMHLYDWWRQDSRALLVKPGCLVRAPTRRANALLLYHVGGLDERLPTFTFLKGWRRKKKILNSSNH
ncbi:hypothetical protein CEXT_479281 [Caerostris extrusa]|uniref:Uncharacterized protein n=1 Tax=Caerostris extrusa TaxID=172846 RepID=A0AAV4U0J6_CAEEX|nr:hypothetical protein CEXT_479281 [Caerostris extrusa]